MKPRSVERPARFLAAGAGAGARLERAQGAQHAPGEAAETDAIERAGLAHDLQRPPGEARVGALQLDDHQFVAKCHEQVAQPGDADAAVAKREGGRRVRGLESEAGIRQHQLIGGLGRHGAVPLGGAPQVLVVDHHDLVIA